MSGVVVSKHPATLLGAVVLVLARARRWLSTREVSVLVVEQYEGVGSTDPTRVSVALQRAHRHALIARGMHPQSRRLARWHFDPREEGDRCPWCGRGGE